METGTYNANRRIEHVKAQSGIQVLSSVRTTGSSIYLNLEYLLSPVKGDEVGLVGLGLLSRQLRPDLLLQLAHLADNDLQRTRRCVSGCTADDSIGGVRTGWHWPARDARSRMPHALAHTIEITVVELIACLP